MSCDLEESVIELSEQAEEMLQDIIAAAKQASCTHSNCFQHHHPHGQLRQR